MKEGMSEIWDCVDGVILAFAPRFVRKDSPNERTFIMWKQPILYSKSSSVVLRGSKTIVSVPSLESAKMLEARLRKHLAKDDLLVKDEKTKKKRPFKLNIKIIECPESAGQLIFKKSKIPVTIHELTRDDIIDEIEKSLKRDIQLIKMYSQNEFEALKEIEKTKSQHFQLMTKAEKILDEKGKYCTNYYKRYTMSYRVTYTDGATCSRKQTPIGDVLIVVNGSSIVDDERMTKQRTDTFKLKHEDKYIFSVVGLDIYREWKQG